MLNIFSGVSHLTGDDRVVGLLDLSTVPRLQDFVVPELVLSRPAIWGLLGGVGALVRVEAVCDGRQKIAVECIADKRQLRRKTVPSYV